MEEVLEKMDYFMELRGRKPVKGYFTAADEIHSRLLN